MSKHFVPNYDEHEQGLDQDFDATRPATVERRSRTSQTAPTHRELIERLRNASPGGTELAGTQPKARSGSSAPATLRAVLYLRVSTEEQAKTGGEAEGYSIPYQRKECRSKAAALGAAVVGEYVDAGESARSSNRPELQRMLGDLRSKHVDLVIVHKIDRLARNRDDDVDINRAIAQAGAKLVSAAEPIDDSPSGRLLYNVMADVAQYHSDNLAVEVLKGMTTKATTGGTPYRAPLGYLNHKEIRPDGSIVRTVVVDDHRAPLVRWAFEAYAMGDWTTITLREALEQKGLTSRPTPRKPAKPISLNTLTHMLHNPYYTGIVVYRGAYHQGKHQPLVTIETWLRVQDVLAAHHLTSEKTRKHPHYLKGTIFCGGCGHRLVYSRNTGNGGTYEYFFCLARRAKRTNCLRSAIRVDAIEAGVERFYSVFRLHPNQVAELRVAIHFELQASQAQAKDEAQRAARRLQHAEDQQRKLLEAHYAGAVPLDLLKTEMHRLTREQANATTQLHSAETALTELQNQLDRVLHVAEHCEQHYAQAPPAIRRQINQGLFQKLYISHDGHVERAEFTEPFATVIRHPTHRPHQGHRENDLDGRGVNETDWVHLVGTLAHPAPAVERLVAQAAGWRYPRDINLVRRATLAPSSRPLRPDGASNKRCEQVAHQGPGSAPNRLRPGTPPTLSARLITARFEVEAERADVAHGTEGL